ncbi:hypothetical protein D3C78_1508740 [compost metagenome]
MLLLVALLQLHRAEGVAVRHRVVLPSADAHRQLARLELRMAAFDHLADHRAAHRVAEHDGRQVAGPFGHPVADRRIDGQIVIAHQDLVLAGTADGSLTQLHIVMSGDALGPALENQLAVGFRFGHCGLPC